VYRPNPQQQHLEGKLYKILIELQIPCISFIQTSQLSNENPRYKHAKNKIKYTQMKRLFTLEETAYHRHNFDQCKVCWHSHICSYPSGLCRSRSHRAGSDIPVSSIDSPSPRPQRRWYTGVSQILYKDNNIYIYIYIYMYINMKTSIICRPSCGFTDQN
jgi:radical SAM protein with 4Fe4S-binding SPASM domain